MEMLSAERQHFLQSLHGLIKDLKESLSEPKNYADDAEISEICFETRELKLFQDEVSGSIFHPHHRFVFSLRCGLFFPMFRVSTAIFRYFTIPN